MTIGQESSKVPGRFFFVRGIALAGRAEDAESVHYPKPKRALRGTQQMRHWHRFSLLIALSTLACGVHWGTIRSDQPPAAPAVSIERIRADVKYLASAPLQGRGIGC